MKKAAYILMALGVLVLVFAAVCFMVAGAMISDVEAYAGYMLGGMPGIETGDLIEMVRSLGFAVGSFDLFAYDYRFWFLAGGGVLLAAGIVMLIVSKTSKAPRAGKSNVAECPVCGALTAGDSAFCMNCGSSIMAKPVIKPVSIDIGSVFCKSCGTENEYGSRFCMNCGAALANGAIDGTVRVAAVPAEEGTLRVATIPAEEGTVRVATVPADEGTVRVAAVPADEGTVRVAAVPADEGTVRINMSDFDEGTVRVAANSPEPADIDTEGTVYISLSDKR